MRALTWQGNEDVQVTDVPDPKIQEPNDAIIRVTSTAICGSDLHLYGVLGPYLKPGDVLGHEAMGIVEEVGADITGLQPGDRVVIPFNISCGHCWMCSRGLFAQCETTQVRAQGKGAALFGYTSLYGSVPGGQAQYLRVPQAPVRADQDSARDAGRPVPVPVGHPAHGLPGRRLRRCSRGRDAGRARPRAGRTVCRPDRPAAGGRAGHRRRPGTGAPGCGRAVRHRDARPRQAG